MATLKIKKGDTVKVIAGKDKDKEGKVLSIKDGKAIVEGINMVTKHAKPSMSNQPHRPVQPDGDVQRQSYPCRLQGRGRKESPHRQEHR